MHWLDNHELAERECRTGWEFEAKVAAYLRDAGVHVVEPDKSWRASVEERHDYVNEVDIVANGLRLSVKSRRVRFTSPQDIPDNRNPLFVDTVRKWRELSPVPAAVVCISQETDGMIWLPRTSANEWGVKHAYDQVRGFAQDFYTARRSLWRPMPELADILRSYWDGIWRTKSGPMTVHHGQVTRANGVGRRIIGMWWHDVLQHARVMPKRVET